MITKAGVDINADDIEDCHRVGNKSQTIIKFGKKKVSRQVLSVRKDLYKVKTSNIDLKGKVLSISIRASAPATRYYGPKPKHYQKGKFDSFYVFIGNIKIRLQENVRPITISHIHNFIKYFPGVDLSVVM